MQQKKITQVVHIPRILISYELMMSQFFHLMLCFDRINFRSDKGILKIILFYYRENYRHSPGDKDLINHNKKMIKKVSQENWLPY